MKTSFFPRLFIGILVMLALTVLHLIPLPIVEVFFLIVIMIRPRWFKNMIDRLYDS
ncbi:hypothetical protein [Methylicorpusculum sp.]|uniref:hypothetical protein n=1 Tax=Methylicorpusculum sp. TaxID=2713644 RepID=UPI00272A4479|nr:hypothetical protein [Methylicorpusculum sp.]